MGEVQGSLGSQTRIEPATSNLVGDALRPLSYWGGPCSSTESSGRGLWKTPQRSDSGDRLALSCSVVAYLVYFRSYDRQSGGSAVTDTFEATLADIISQESVFKDRDERAVEIGVVLPLLKEVGWNTANLSEIYPQRRLSNGYRVDYDLQIGGQSRILIEVKSWGNDLQDKDETQLLEYCKTAKPRPKLAVLTNGRVWRLYLAPTAAKGKNSVLRRFDEVDIAGTELEEVKETFRQFLGRDSMVIPGPTVKEARMLHNDWVRRQKSKKALTEALSKLANDTDMQVELVLKFAQNMGIETNRKTVTTLIESFGGPVVNKPGTKASPLPRPASFRLPSAPGKSKETHSLEKHNGWNNFLLEVCELMQKQHPEDFRQEILTVPGWFDESESSKFSIPIGDVGVYVRKENAAYKIRDACYEIVAKFGYSRDSLEIMDSSDKRIPEHA